MSTPQDTPVIRKGSPLRASSDYDFLRERGLEYVRELSGKIWTDHNLHDPGITSLEALCYALTDLGYRTSFDIDDLLVRDETGAHDDPELSGLFPAHEVLPTAPLTIDDYRRLLLRIEGVRNAWFDPMVDLDGDEATSEVPLYAHCEEGPEAAPPHLTEQPRTPEGEDNLRVHVRGLYRVLLELEVDDVLGSLNETRLSYRVRRGPLKGVILSVDATDPQSLEVEAGLSGVDHVEPIPQQAIDDAKKTGASIGVRVRVTLDDGTDPVLGLSLRVVEAKPRPDRDPIDLDRNALRAAVAEDEVDSLVRLFWKKQQRRRASIATVRCVLDAHRNLCEDFLAVDTVMAERIGVCADLELAPDADIELVEARTYQEIEQYLNPPIPYFTLKELLDEGWCADEIFNGPFVDYTFECDGERVFTKPGLIKGKHLEAASLRRDVYASDLINILMEIDDVLAVRHMRLIRYDADGRAEGPGNKWCLEVTRNRQPVLDIDRSKLLFLKDGIPYRAGRTEVRRTLDHLREKAKRAAYVEPDQTFDPPRGRSRQLGRHYSVQHDFPRTYGIGVAGLPSNVADKRTAQARQLKAYLTFFDQVLADYLAQLANVRRLFSLDPDLKQTYFTQVLQEYDPVTRSGLAGVRAAFPEEFYDETVSVPAGVSGIEVEQKWTPLTEDEDIFFDRRNRILDHLTARFAEQFTDYVMLMFELHSGDRLHSQKQLIDAKLAFLQDYPALSRDRNRAFNYRPHEPSKIWETDNVSGLEKRVRRLAGFRGKKGEEQLRKQRIRRDLACANLFEEVVEIRPASGRFRVEVRSATRGILFKSFETFDTEAEAKEEAKRLFPALRRESSYEIREDQEGKLFWIIEGEGITLRHDQLFERKEEAEESLRRLLERYDQALAASEDCEIEGLHLFEHILLRPVPRETGDAFDADDFLDICLEPGCETCGDEDPYSFRLTAVLPYWTDRFRSLHFRRFFERLLRQEAPAHTHVRICWVGHADMAALDAAYKAWLNTKAKQVPNLPQLRRRQRTLISVLKRLRTVYPELDLHDCREGDDENIARLDTSHLGIY